MKLFNFKKLISLPTPKELGKSVSNSLPIDMFSDDGDYTWEQYEIEMKYQYPIKYFFLKELPKWFRIYIKMNIDNFLYWFRCNTYDKYHMLDLRQPEEFDNSSYRWGWIDADIQMRYANFNILCNFCEKEIKIFDAVKNLQAMVLEAEEWELPVIVAQLKAYQEIQDLYHWWKFEREQENNKKDNLLSAWSNIRKSNKEEAEELLQDYSLYEKKLDDKETENLIRLINIRHYLWT